MSSFCGELMFNFHFVDGSCLTVSDTTAPADASAVAAVVGWRAGAASRLRALSRLLLDGGWEQPADCDRCRGCGSEINELGYYCNN